MEIRAMTVKDYDQVYQLWTEINGFGIRSIDDSKEGVEKFLLRNPGISAIAEDGGKIVGTILCGHDGRRGSFYHVCVSENYRHQGIGSQMSDWCMEALKKEGINKVSLIAFKSNSVGNQFWQQEGWEYREDINYYDLSLNDCNITKFVSGL